MGVRTGPGSKLSPPAKKRAPEKGRYGFTSPAITQDRAGGRKPTLRPHQGHHDPADACARQPRSGPHRTLPEGGAVQKHLRRRGEKNPEEDHLADDE